LGVRQLLLWTQDNDFGILYFLLALQITVSQSLSKPKGLKVADSTLNWKQGARSTVLEFLMLPQQ
jgi:hypothetical protein